MMDRVHRWEQLLDVVVNPGPWAGYTTGRRSRGDNSACRFGARRPHRAATAARVNASAAGGGAVVEWTTAVARGPWRRCRVVHAPAVVR